jgi:DNA-binding transcriptional regulator YiaG
LIGVSVKTLQNWEQDRRRPTGPAAALLRIIAYEPRLAVKAIHQT